MALTPPLRVMYNDAKTSLEVSPIGSGKFSQCARVLSTQPVSTGREPFTLVFNGEFSGKHSDITIGPETLIVFMW